VRPLPRLSVKNKPGEVFLMKALHDDGALTFSRVRHAVVEGARPPTFIDGLTCGFAVHFLGVVWVVYAVVDENASSKEVMVSLNVKVIERLLSSAICFSAVNGVFFDLWCTA